MKALFGGVIAIVLLGLYVHLVRVALLVVNCVTTSGCNEYTSSYFNDGMAQALSIISGLVSALVIAELAITKPGEAPVARAFEGTYPVLGVRVVRIIAVLYVFVWIATGLWAFIVGLYHPTELPALTNLGQAWLGLAVAAAYAYFGLKPQ